MTQSEVTHNFDAVLARLREGAEVVVEQAQMPGAVIRLPRRSGRPISECIASARASASAATLDEEFAQDVNAGIESRQQPDPNVENCPIARRRRLSTCTEVPELPDRWSRTLRCESRSAAAVQPRISSGSSSFPAGWKRPSMTIRPAPPARRRLETRYYRHFCGALRLLLSARRAARVFLNRRGLGLEVNI